MVNQRYELIRKNLKRLMKAGRLLWGGGLVAHIRTALDDRHSSAPSEKVKKAWSRANTPLIHCWHIPAVNGRWNRLVTGDESVTWQEYVTKKYIGDKDNLVGLSLACGMGQKELGWAATGRFARLDAYDLTEQRIEYARKTAAEKRLDGVCRFIAGDVYDIDCPDGCYDIVLAESSLHHFTPLEDLLVRIDGYMKPDGFLFVNDFVGPTRFQWTDRQMEVVNGLLAVLPHRYRVLWESEKIKTRVDRPSVASMISSDPSEAVESSNIMPLLKKVFEVVEVREYGGTIIHLLFDSIAQHFRSDDPETALLLKLCFEVEDALLASGDIQSDFAVVVCRKKGSAKQR